MDRDYVSEFTMFMDQFLKDHPEVVKDQARGWSIYWNPRGDREARKHAEEDRVPDDQYGFHSMN